MSAQKGLVAGHSALPWKVFKTPDGRKIVGIGKEDGEGICDAGFGIWAWDDPEGIANADLIVERVNGWDALLAERDRLLADNATLLSDLRDCSKFAGEQLRNTSNLLSNPPQSSAAWDIRNFIDKKLESAALAGHEQAGAKAETGLRGNCWCEAYTMAAGYPHRPTCTAAPTMTAEQMREACVNAAFEAGNFKDYLRHELTPDFGQPRFDMMADIVRAIRALPASPGKGGGA